MTGFILGCIGLLLISGLFYLLPGRSRKLPSAGRDEYNMEWYRLREAELEKSGETGLLQDMQLRLLEDSATGGEARASSGGSFPRWVLLPVIAIASSILYSQLGAAPDVEISRQLKLIDAQTTPAQMQQFVQALQSRSSERPDNLSYRALLGRFYMGQNNYRGAAETYTALAKEVPGDDQILASAAQAQYLADDRKLGHEAQMYAEQALAINPHQRTALGLLGMASYEQGQYRAAIAYWERLIAVESPDSESARMIQSIIERARQKLGQSGESVATAQPASEATAATASAGVSVRVSVPEGGRIAPTSTVFILARAANAESRMPIAVQRRSGSELPISLRLDDSNSMAGQKLSAAESVVVVVQVSPDGRPGEANASWLGSAGPMQPSVNGQPVDIILNPVN